MVITMPRKRQIVGIRVILAQDAVARSLAGSSAVDPENIGLGLG